MARKPTLEPLRAVVYPSGDREWRAATSDRRLLSADGWITVGCARRAAEEAGYLVETTSNLTETLQALQALRRP